MAGPSLSREALQKGIVALLYGGMSSEREVSLKSGAAMAEGLRRRGYRVELVDAGRDVGARLAALAPAAVVIALHGKWGEDGSVQGLLECMGLPYTGSGVLASAVAMNKRFAKQMFKLAGLPVAPDVYVAAADIEGFAPERLPFEGPWVFKPEGDGSSVGISIVKRRDAADMRAALRAAAALGDGVLVEQFVAGGEIQVAIFDDEPLGTIEICPAEEFYNYAAKYTAGTTSYYFPARIPPERAARCEEVALGAHRALGCAGVSRVDLRLPPVGDPVLLEVNTLPGMTATSLVPKIAKGKGIEFDELCERILLSARLHVGVPA